MRPRSSLAEQAAGNGLGEAAGRAAEESTGRGADDPRACSFYEGGRDGFVERERERNAGLPQAMTL